MSLLENKSIGNNIQGYFCIKSTFLSSYIFFAGLVDDFQHKSDIGFDLYMHGSLSPARGEMNLN